MADKPHTLTWDQSWSTGVKEFDDDHKYLASLYNQLFTACYAGQGPSVALAIVEKLVDYTNDHFRREDILFRQYDYPGREAHIHEHDLLRERLEDLMEVLSDTSKPHEISNATLAFLHDWIERH
ncbi:MAG: hemerythrin family protein, partial [Alphaproteobacteria bacterium]|nr:hemerythrin family protein [Alphaproteobacteria bacterium]